MTESIDLHTIDQRGLLNNDMHVISYHSWITAHLEAGAQKRRTWDLCVDALRQRRGNALSPSAPPPYDIPVTPGTSPN